MNGYPPVTLSRAKLYLRLISDESDTASHPEDDLIQSLIEAAQAAVENEIHGKISDPPEEPLVQAMLMTIESLYDKRGESEGIPPGARSLCTPYRLRNERYV